MPDLTADMVFMLEWVFGGLIVVVIVLRAGLFFYGIAANFLSGIRGG